MKKRKPTRDIQFKIRLLKNEYTFIKNSAEVYADGDLSKWARHCLMNYEPKYIKKRASKNEGPQKE